MKPHRIRMTHNLVLNYGLYRKMEIFVSYQMLHICILLRFPVYLTSRYIAYTYIRIPPSIDKHFFQVHYSNIFITLTMSYHISNLFVKLSLRCCASTDILNIINTCCYL